MDNYQINIEFLKQKIKNCTNKVANYEKNAKKFIRIKKKHEARKRSIKRELKFKKNLLNEVKNTQKNLIKDLKLYLTKTCGTAIFLLLFFCVTYSFEGLFRIICTYLIGFGLPVVTILFSIQCIKKIKNRLSLKMEFPEYQIVEDIKALEFQMNLEDIKIIELQQKIERYEYIIGYFVEQINAYDDSLKQIINARAQALAEIDASIIEPLLNQKYAADESVRDILKLNRRKK